MSLFSGVGFGGIGNLTDKQHRTRRFFVNNDHKWPVAEGWHFHRSSRDAANGDGGRFGAFFIDGYKRVLFHKTERKIPFGVHIAKVGPVRKCRWHTHLAQNAVEVNLVAERKLGQTNVYTTRYHVFL